MLEYSSCNGLLYASKDVLIENKALINDDPHGFCNVSLGYSNQYLWPTGAKALVVVKTSKVTSTFTIHTGTFLTIMCEIFGGAPFEYSFNLAREFRSLC